MFFQNIEYRFLIIISRVFDIHVGTIIEFRYAIFFKIKFLKNAPNMSSHEPIIPHEHYILI